MQIGFIGLGKMGSRMALKLVKEGHDVVVWNRSKEPLESIKYQVLSIKGGKERLRTASSVQELIQSLKKPRVIWSMLPAVAATEEMLSQIAKYVEANDIVIDGGNSKYTDTQRWYETFKKKKIRFLGIGVSGGVIAVKEGYPLMVGGDKSAHEYIAPILKSLSKPHGGHEYFGEGGAGHFVKMIHNAIEYGYMQAIGEGFGVLENSEYKFDLIKAAKLYQKGTLISGFMMDRTLEALEKDPKLSHITGLIGKASGETIWTVEEAHKQQLFIENIEQALEFRNRSEKDTAIQKSFAARMVSALRNAFGGHEVKKK